MRKIAVLVSHPIQHFCPQYASWAKMEGMQIRVFFGSNMGAKPYKDKDFGKELRWDNLYLDEFEHEFLNGELTLPPDKNLAASTLGVRLEDFAPDILILYGYFQQLSRDGRKWAIKNNVPIAYISDAERRQHRPIWKEWLKFPLLYTYFKPIQYFLTVGDSNESYYRFYGVPGHKLKRMHFPIDIRQYEEAKKNKESLRSIFRNKYGIHTGTTVVSVVGKLVEWKSQDHLIKLLKVIKQKQPATDMAVVIAGSGAMENEWKELADRTAGKQVIFTGFVTPEELPALYAATDIYIHPARIEPHSLSISEAIYMGCPAIVSDTCGSWGENDDIQPGRNGYVYKYGDIEELAGQVIQLSDPAVRQSMGDISHKNAVLFQQKAHGGFFGKIKNNKI